MKIYIFKPSKSWLYCGGAIVILANSFRSAKDFLILDDDSRAKKEPVVYKTEDENTHQDTEDWILDSEFEVVGEDTERVVLNNWNWA